MHSKVGKMTGLPEKYIASENQDHRLLDTLTNMLLLLQSSSTMIVTCLVRLWQSQVMGM